MIVLFIIFIAFLLVWIIADLICIPGRIEWDHGVANHGYFHGEVWLCG